MGSFTNKRILRKSLFRSDNIFKIGKFYLKIHTFILEKHEGQIVNPWSNI